MEPAKFDPQNKMLPIALLVSVIIFVCAFGAAIVVYAHRSNSQKPQEPTVDKSETRNVTKVEWVPPAIPSDYTQSDEYTQDVQATVYTGLAAGCTLTSRVAPVTDEAQKMVVKALDAPGFTTKDTTKTSPTDFADIDGIHTYPFTGLEADQSVSVPEISVTSQDVILYYRQFGQHIASLTVACKSGSDQAVKLQDFITIAQQFKLKTERQ